jgi:hypothetical protein
MPRSAKTTILALVLSSALAGGASLASAATYDLVSDWSSSNPNGPWAYLQGSTLLPYQPSVVPLGGNPGFAPCPNYGCFLPLFWQNGGPGSDIFIHSVDAANGDPANGEAMLTWTAPATGTIDISGYLYYGQYGLQRSNDYFLDLGASSLATGTLSYLNASGPANEVHLSFTDLPVTVGEVLSLTLQRSSGEQYGTETGLDLTVAESVQRSVVPEPATWVMMVVGLGAVGAAMRFRREELPTPA